MLTGCEFLSVFMEDIDGEVYELPTSRFEIFPDKEEYFIGETIKINIAFEPDFSKFEKYEFVIRNSYTEYEEELEGTLKFDGSEVANIKEYIFDSNTLLENSKIEKEVKLEFLKKGFYELYIRIWCREKNDRYIKYIRKNITIR